MMEKEQVTRMQNSDLKELLEDVTLNEIHLSNEERQEMTSTFLRFVRKKKRKTQKIRIWSAVAICACVVSAVLGWYSTGQLTVLSAEKEGVLVELPDQSVAWLNRNTSLRYNRWGFRFFREVKLKGEAYFDVRKGSRFVVNADPYKVFVLGTRFSVSQKNGQFKAYCFQGKIKVENGKLSCGQVLTANQNISVVLGKVSLNIQKELEPVWVKKQCVYENIPLNDVIKKLQEVYGITVLCNGYCDSLRFTGIFPADDLDLAMQLVFGPFNLECKNVGGEWRLYRVE
ncbi:FecR family protein [Bacteroides hominis]|uniref:FecR family protein n=1 Tax=Bacteroides hominis TaxID=2763023 RepID=UPI003D6C16C6